MFSRDKLEALFFIFQKLMALGGQTATSIRDCTHIVASKVKIENPSYGIVSTGRATKYYEHFSLEKFLFQSFCSDHENHQIPHWDIRLPLHRQSSVD